MKKFFIAFFSILESMGRARAATHFARQGDYESARRVMND